MSYVIHTVTIEDGSCLREANLNLGGGGRVFHLPNEVKLQLKI